MNAHIPPNNGAGMSSGVPVYGYAVDWEKKREWSSRNVEWEEYKCEC